MSNHSADFVQEFGPTILWSEAGRERYTHGELREIGQKMLRAGHDAEMEIEKFRARLLEREPMAPVSGDGTPGHAREAARCPDCGEKCQPGTIHNCPYRGPLQVPGDSGGPREALKEWDDPDKHLAEADHFGYTPDPWASEIVRLRLEVSRLRAELGRAGTVDYEQRIRLILSYHVGELLGRETETWEQAAQIADAESVKWNALGAWEAATACRSVAIYLRARAAAPDAERPSEIERVMRLIADDYTAYNIGYVQQYREMARAAIAADAERREPP